MRELTMSKITMKTVLLASIVVIIAGTGFIKFGLVSEPNQPEVVGLLQPASCDFSVGQQSAFKLQSSVTADNQSDTFKGVMSWHVDELNEDIAKIRASFSDVELKQAMTLPEERAASPQGQTFFLEVNKSCVITSTAFTQSWEPKTQLLVAALLDNLTFSLPKTNTSQWQISALDGLGDYTARFNLVNDSPVQIHRAKNNHLTRGAVDDFGLILSVNKSTATATFNTDMPIWWQSITGEEEISVKVQNEPEILMLQTFSLQRDDRFIKLSR